MDNKIEYSDFIKKFKKLMIRVNLNHKASPNFVSNHQNTLLLL